ncbi:hypothetical protein C8R47DRAFT_1271517 [Mycena vitilis]|nr:hypothetical protein C8R47DRAFT_1271517 [Mycena vitilis]
MSIVSCDTTTTTDLHIDKKRKLDSDSDYSDSESEPNWDPDDDFRQDIASDIALEIGLRQRLLHTVESRIQWAICLQEALMNDASESGQLSDFKAIALDALSAIDAPAEILFARDEPAPPLDTRRPSFAKKSRKKPTTRVQPAKKASKFLYIKREGKTEPSILRCPMCMRTEFSSLHGLFNHARGTHSLAWTSHDECVRHCACALEQVQGGPVDFTDLDAGVEVGTNAGGVLPGVRSLIEQAVGEGDNFDFEGETALSRTLGYHADTPALANFLGKDPIRRGVVVWDPDAVVDIDGFDDDKAHVKPRWRMPFSHRNTFRDAPLPTSAPSPPFEAPAPPPQNTTNIPRTAGSRFHIATRIVVVDRSLWLPPEQRLGQDTHKWMISIDAPSYTRHITTVLHSLTVISPTGRLMTAAPPFAVIGTAHTPFLARIELAFCASAGGARQQVVLEHWVELDRMQSMGVVHGEEQVVDVELDRGTVFLPLRAGYIPINTRALWDMDIESERHSPLEMTSDVPVVEVAGSGKEERRTRNNNNIPKVKMLGSWQSVLKKLVERFPLTLQDVKGGKAPNPALPYKLVANPAQFSSLVMGRKKAVEWGRATAMRDAYSDAVLNGLTEDVTTLTTADIFSWLHTNGYFPRGTATLKKEQDLQVFKTGMCRVCGLPYRLHSLSSDPTSQPRPLTGVDDTFVCQIAPAEWQMQCMPMIDVSRILPRRTQAASPAAQSTLIVPLKRPLAAQAYRRPEARVGDATWDSRVPALLTVSDPTLVAAIRRHVSALKLRSFVPPTPPAAAVVAGLPHFPINPALSATETQIEVAPYAMLALLTKLFVRTLVKTGLEVAVRDRQRAMVQVDGRARRLQSVGDVSGERERRMLTPSHVLRGVVSRGWDWNDEIGAALTGCLARSGVPLRPSQPQAPPQQPAVGGQGAAAVQTAHPAAGEPMAPQFRNVAGPVNQVQSGQMPVNQVRGQIHRAAQLQAAAAQAHHRAGGQASASLQSPGVGVREETRAEMEPSAFLINRFRVEQRDDVPSAQ